jgi:hypothetical protein
MILRHLEFLTALARERHFARAAVSCKVTQSTLSAGIKQMEESLGVLPVERGQRFLLRIHSAYLPPICRTAALSICISMCHAGQGAEQRHGSCRCPLMALGAQTFLLERRIRLRIHWPR